MSGIASGVGVGAIRVMSAGAFIYLLYPRYHRHTFRSGFLIGSHWAVGTFMLVSLGTWYVLRAQLYRNTPVDILL